MDELFGHLEMKLKELIQHSHYQQQANDKLQQGKMVLTNEKEMLLNKYKSAITQIENMVSRLKLIEKPQ
jgi:uncharacterized protein (TIGR02449 family)